MKIRFLAFFLLSMLFASNAFSQDDAVSYYEYGNDLFSQGNYDQAIEYYRQAISLNADFWQAYQGLGTSYYMKGDYPTSLAQVSEALMLNPGDKDLIAFKGQLEALVGAARSDLETIAAPSQGEPGAAAIDISHFQERSLDKIDLQGQYYFSFNVGLCKIWEDVYEQIAAEYNPYADTVVSVDSHEYVPGKAAINIHFGGGKQIGRYFLLGLGVIYSKVKLLESKTVVEPLTGPSASTVLEMDASGNLMVIGPELMVKFPMDSFIFLLRGGIGYARGSMEESISGILEESISRSYSPPDAGALLGWSAASSGLAVSLGGEMAVPIGSAMFVSLEVSVLAAAMGNWIGAQQNEDVGSLDGVLMEGDNWGSSEVLGYWMRVVGDDNVSEAEAAGLSKAKINLGGYALRFGFGFQF